MGLQRRKRQGTTGRLMAKRWEEISLELANLDSSSQLLRKEWELLKESCGHPRLPKRDWRLEDYSDTCPDCGYVAYFCMAGL
jgi:hypothetical protein